MRKRFIQSQMSAVDLFVTPSEGEPLGRYGCQFSEQHVVAGVARHVGDPVVAVAAAYEATAYTSRSFSKVA